MWLNARRRGRGRSASSRRRQRGRLLVPRPLRRDAAARARLPRREDASPGPPPGPGPRLPAARRGGSRSGLWLAPPGRRGRISGAGAAPRTVLPRTGGGAFEVRARPVPPPRRRAGRAPAAGRAAGLGGRQGRRRSIFRVRALRFSSCFVILLRFYLATGTEGR